jgi:hypothetical protein
VKTKQYSQHPEAIVSRKRKAAYTEEQRQQEKVYQFRYRLKMGQSKENRDIYRQRVLNQVANFREEVKIRRRVLREYKAWYGCLDCGFNNPLALDFDHRVRKEKFKGVSQMVHRHSMERIWAEVAKCDVVCRNCHALRTFEQMGWVV